VRTTIHTQFHIDFDWWASRGRNLRSFLIEILGDAKLAPASTEPVDYIDPATAEVHVVDSLMAKVLLERAHRPDYITSSTPLTNAVLRALIEELNRPMTPVQLHRRINRTSPEAILRVLQTARLTYGIVPVVERAEPATVKPAKAPKSKKKKVPAQS
jgi:hypothetical protein